MLYRSEKRKNTQLAALKIWKTICLLNYRYASPKLENIGRCLISVGLLRFVGRQRHARNAAFELGQPRCTLCEVQRHA